MANKKAAALGKLVAAVVGTVTLLAGCSGGGGPAETPESTQPPAPRVTAVPVESSLEVSQVVTLDYKPGSDGFGFSNYGGGNAPAALTVNLARRLYGDEQACASVNDAGECTPQPVILQLIEQANRAMAGGLCEGFAVLSLRLYQEGGTTSLLGQEAIVAALEQGDPRVAAELAFWFVTQFASETQAAAAFYREQSPSEIVATLADDFANPATTAGYTLGLYSAEGGHAVTPYAVEAVEGGSRIYIYDSNWPTEDRWIDVVDNTWTYALAATNPTEAASAWTGGTGTLELTPMASRQPPFSCAFCPRDDGKKSMTLLTAASSSDSQVSLQVVDDQGRRLGVFDGELVNEIPGAVYRYIATSSTSDPVLILLPASVENYTADVQTLDNSTDGAISLFVAQDGAAARVETTIADITDEADDEPVLAVSEDDGYEINDLDEAAVDIADQNVSVSVVIQDDQELAFQFAPLPDPVEAPESDVESEPGEAPHEAPPAPTAPQIVLSIATDDGEQVAEIEISQTEEDVPEEIVIEIDEEGEVEIVVEEIEARPATIVAELRELVEERLAEEPDETDLWFEEPEEGEEDPFTLDLDDDFWDEETWEDDWYDEDDEWVWVESEDFVEWVEDEGAEVLGELLDDEFLEEMELIIERTEELIEELPDRIEGEWSDDGWTIEIEIVEADDELTVIEDPLPPIEEWPDDPEEETHDGSLDPLPDSTIPDWDDDWWNDDEEIEEEPWQEPELMLPEWETEEDDDWTPDEDNSTPDEADDTDDPLADDGETPDEEEPEPTEPPDEVDTDEELPSDEPEDEEPGVDEEPEEEIEEPEPEPEFIPQPSWEGETNSTWEDLGQTSSTATTAATTVLVTSSLSHNSSDGNWYQEVTTATTVTETAVVSTSSSTRLRTDEYWCYDDGYGNGGCGGGTSYGETQVTTTVTDPSVTSATTSVVTTIPASCDQGGWTGFGDWCIVSTPTQRSQREVVQFTVPDDTSVSGEMRRIVIRAETNLTYAAFNSNSQFADAYVYLYEDDDADVGDHTGDIDEYTRGTFIESDDDGGRDCGTETGETYADCTSPPNDATDPDEFPNDVIAWDDGDTPVIDNVSDSWDAEIDRLMEPGDYAVEGTVYNANNAGWYRLTISDETIESSGS